jgi:hypothetical protein
VDSLHYAIFPTANQFSSLLQALSQMTHLAGKFTSRQKTLLVFLFFQIASASCFEGAFGNYITTLIFFGPKILKSS